MKALWEWFLSLFSKKEDPTPIEEPAKPIDPPVIPPVIDPMPWMKIAIGELGQKEIPGPKDNPRIKEYQKVTGNDISSYSDEVPWCASFVSWCLEQAGVKSTKNGMAMSYYGWGKDVKADPPYGAIVVWQWSSGGHHVSFFEGWSDSEKRNVKEIGGNQSDAVTRNEYASRYIIAMRMPS